MRTIGGPAGSRVMKHACTHWQERLAHTGSAGAECYRAQARECEHEQHDAVRNWGQGHRCCVRGL
eukprot:8621962-Alexandrium_andersonii.AAC.1